MSKSNWLFKFIIISIITITLLPVSLTPVYAKDQYDVKNSVVAIISTSPYDGSLKGWGTGFAIGEKGKKVEYIVTNAHVVFDMTTGEPYDVSICYSNAENDFVTPTIYKEL